MELSKKDIKRLKGVVNYLGVLQNELKELIGKYETDPEQIKKTKQQLQEEEDQRIMEKYERRYFRKK